MHQRGSSVQHIRPEATFLHSALCVASLSPQVSAFVRVMLYDPEMRLNGGSVIAYDPCATAASEASLLTSVLDLYACGALPAGLQDIGEDMVRMSSSSSRKPSTQATAVHQTPLLRACWAGHHTSMQAVCGVGPQGVAVT